jgi:hypothetical protein
VEEVKDIIVIVVTCQDSHGGGRWRRGPDPYLVEEISVVVAITYGGEGAQFVHQIHILWRTFPSPVEERFVHQICCHDRRHCHPVSKSDYRLILEGETKFYLYFKVGRREESRGGDQRGEGRRGRMAA